MKKDLRIIIEGNDLTESVASWTMNAVISEEPKFGMMVKTAVGKVYSIQFTDGTVELFDGKKVEFKEVEQPKPTASKYAELSIAKLNNMDLVLLHKHEDWEFWSEEKAANREENPHFMVSDRFDYFLCLKQHTKACLHWLNGGGVLVMDFPGETQERVILAGGYSGWYEATIFMSSECDIQIMPSKEELQLANAKALFNASLPEVKKARPGVDYSVWSDLDESDVKYWCGFAESIGFKAGE